jgi:hypothetical protein
MIVGMVAAFAATAIIDASDGKMDTEAKYYVANTLIGGIIGIGVGLTWGGIVALASEGIGFGIGTSIGGGALVLSSTGSASISVTSVIAGTEIISGVGVLGGIICMFSKPNSGKIRFSDDTGIDPENGNIVIDRDRAYKIYHEIKDKAKRLKWKKWMKGKGWIPTHLGK